MTRAFAHPAQSVTLNSFQGPSSLVAPSVPEEKWMLKQVQHDEEGEGRA